MTNPSSSEDRNDQGVPSQGRGFSRRAALLTTAGTAAAAGLASLPASAYAAPAPVEGRGRPKGSGPLWSWSATELAHGIRRGHISSVDATESALERLKAVNPRINAVAETLEADALAAAREADRALRGRGRRHLGALHGVPVTTKINVDYAGHATTNGVVAFRDRLAAEDSSAVANLKAAGAVIIGRTNVPAFSFRWFSDNALHGRTLNPWDPARTPGGSSGGAAVATAVGIGAIAHGTDIAGSVRYPAWACGVAGIRPTPGRAAGFNPSGAEAVRTMTSQLMAVQGLMARRVADLRLGLPPLSVRDVRDPWWTPVPVDVAGPQAKVVAIVRRLPGVDVDPLNAMALDRAATALRAAGYRVEDVVPPRFEEAAELWSSLVMAESRHGFADAINTNGDAAIKRALETWLSVTPDLSLAEFSKLLGVRDQIAREWRVFMEKYPVVLTPVSWARQFPIDHDQKGPDIFRGILQAQGPMLAVAMLGFPALSVPTGTAEGLPLGVQVVADRFREMLCFDVGEAIERRWNPETPIDPRS